MSQDLNTSKHTIHFARKINYLCKMATNITQSIQHSVASLQQPALTYDQQMTGET
jgi:hypothetical protein